MLSKKIYNSLLANLNFEPTKNQDNLFKKLADFILSNDESILIIRGYAGTGKTSSISAFIKTLKELKQKAVLMAPTGRAAKVLTQYSGNPAFTIHRKIYRQKSSSDGFGKFVLNSNLNSDTFFIIDEASMIAKSSNDQSIFGSGNLLDDLINYVDNNKRCKLILSGDVAQLPPVGLDISPALDTEEFEIRGYKAGLVNLKNVVRQKDKSNILRNATEIRTKIDNNDFSVYKHLTNEVDFISINGSELIEKITDSYDKNGISETIIINRSNKRANKYNEGVRNQILWREEEISPGDMLMIVKNNYFWLKDNENIDFIANGDIAHIKKISNIKHLYNKRFAYCSLELPDYNDYEFDAWIMLDTLRSDSPSLPYDENKDFFYQVMEDYKELKNKKQQYQKVKENEFFNALQVKFAYAVTCHKAQGGQWKNVFIDQGFVKNESLTKEYFRWIYTAITRATEKVYLINFPKEFLNNPL